MAQQLWLVSVPRNGQGADSLFANLQNAIGKSGSARAHKFDYPNFTVGTLDSLMTLSDDLVKLNMQVENVVRKVERQYNDVATTNPDPLKVNNSSIETYLKNFQWDFARYRTQGKPLPEIVGQIQSMAGKVDEELKKLAQAHTEKQQNLAGLQRKKSANLATADLEDVLKPEEVDKVEQFNTESLITLLVVVPASAEKDFLNTYYTLGENIANYGGPDWSDVFAVGKNDGRFGPALSSVRASVKGSPVAPESAHKLKAEGEFVLYTIVAIKGQHEAGVQLPNGEFSQGRYVDYLEPLKAAYRDKRFVIRDFSYDRNRAGGLDGQIEKAKMEAQQSTNSLTRWCSANFGELYAGWIHLKIVRGFVESVLRYGLPVEYVSMFVVPNMRKEKVALKHLTKNVLKTIPDLSQDGMAPAEEDETEEDMADSLPFVFQPFTVIGSGVFQQ